MIKLINCNTKLYLNKITKILNDRRYPKNQDIKIVKKILKDIAKHKTKALKKFELRFSKNNQIKISNSQVKTIISKLNPKVKKAIDFSYKRITNFHIR